MRRRTINNMNGGYRGYTQQTDTIRPTPPPDTDDDGKKDDEKKDEGKKDDPKTIIKKVNNVGPLVGTTIGSLFAGAVGGIVAYRAYQNKQAIQGVGYNIAAPKGVGGLYVNLHPDEVGEKEEFNYKVYTGR